MNAHRCSRTNSSAGSQGVPGVHLGTHPGTWCSVLGTGGGDMTMTGLEGDLREAQDSASPVASIPADVESSCLKGG